MSERNAGTGATHDSVTERPPTWVLQAIADPGMRLSRGGAYTEPIPSWSARAVTDAIVDRLASPEMADAIDDATMDLSRDREYRIPRIRAVYLAAVRSALLEGGAS